MGDPGYKKYYLFYRVLNRDTMQAVEVPLNAKSNVERMKQFIDKLIADSTA